MYDNKWRLIKPVESSNYVLNPSAEIAGNFSDIAGATTSRSTTYQKYGLYSYYVDVAAANDGTRLTLQALTNAEHYVTLRVRKPYPVLYATLNSTTKELRFIEKIDQNWDLLGIGFAASEANGATALDIIVGSAVDFYFDGAQVEPLHYWTTYIDGTQAGCEWLGATHGSRSRRANDSRAGGRSVDFYEEYGFFIQKIVGAGSAPKTLGVDSYALLPGGELNSVKVNTRDWTIVGTFYAESEQKLHENIQALDTELQNSSYVGSQPYLIRFNGAKVQKEIASHYRGGLEGDLPAYYEECRRQDGDKWIKVLEWTTDASIQMQSPNPYWYEVGESAELLDTNDSATFDIVAARLRSTGQWDELGPPDAAGTYTDVRAIVEDDTYIYIGGDFENFNNIANADYVARYNKQTGVWSALDTGVDDVVYALAIGPDGTLYAGGYFLNAGGGGANYIASWDGAAWGTLGVGMNNPVHALIFGLDGTLYACGQFTTAGGGAALRIASWDGAAWAALGAGLDGNAYALAVAPDGTLYVGGFFLNAGGAGANRIASWDGSSWSPLGSGLNANVFSIVIDSNNILYVGGVFTTAGGISANYIASWNGIAWSPLSSGMNSNVYYLAIGSDNTLYAGGIFTTAGGITLADRLARWNGSTWAHLDIDLPGTPTIYAIYASTRSDPVVAQNYDLWVGFTTTGTGYLAGLVTIDNEGNVPAYPKITYNRSGGTSATIATLRNERSGRTLLFDYALLDGETLTIDLHPTQKSITSSIFGNVPKAILSNSDFGSWVLKPNDNDVTSFVIVAGAPTVTAWLLWRDGYDGYN